MSAHWVFHNLWISSFKSLVPKGEASSSPEYRICFEQKLFQFPNLQISQSQNPLMISPIAFYILSAVIIGCALLVVSVRNIFHAGLFLIGAFLGVAGIYVSLQNFFLAAAQLLIYSGAIAVLILFGIMMTEAHWSREAPTHNTLRSLSFAAAAGLLGILAFAYIRTPVTFLSSHRGDVLRGIGASLMRAYMIPFEIISLILLAALIGAIAIAKEDKRA